MINSPYMEEIMDIIAIIVGTFGAYASALYIIWFINYITGNTLDIDQD